MANSLYEAIVAASRRSALYGDDRVPDTLDGRLEMVTLHAGLVLARLRVDGAREAVGEPLANRIFRSIDAGLREAGVGDLSVPRQMRRLAQSFYGRVSAYDAAAVDGDALAEALARNVWNRDAHSFAAPLAAYVQGCRAVFALTPIARMADLSDWPAPPNR